MSLTIAVVAANTMMDALGPLLNNGYLRLYTSPRPATPETAITTQTLLAELRFANPTAFAASGGAQIIANAMTPDASANASGTATWFRALKSDGTTAIVDGTVGVSSGDATMNTTTIVITTAVSCGNFYLQLPVV